MAYTINCTITEDCPEMYMCNPLGICEHALFPLTMSSITGSVLIAFISGLATLAGLGGGGAIISFLILLFNYSPKISTLLVYCMIFGGTLGNVINQATTLVNGKPMIIYRYCFVSIPYMFAGSLVGVIINKFFPSAVVVTLILVTTTSSLKSIYNRFRQSYQKETEENQQPEILRVRKEVVMETINAFQSAENRELFKKLLLLMAVFLILQLIRGSERFGSIIGIHACSFAYWTVETLLFFSVYVFGRWNLSIIRLMQEKEIMLVDGKVRSEPLDQKAFLSIIQNSILGGLYSGFGLGGGLFLVPMYKSLGLNPLQATASTSFNILITATLNTAQAIFIGAIHFDELVYFTVLTVIGSYTVSKILSKELQKRNRLSFVELMLVIMLGVSLFNIPYGVIMKYIESGYDSRVIFGFGRLC